MRSIGLQAEARLPHHHIGVRRGYNAFGGRHVSHPPTEKLRLVDPAISISYQRCTARICRPLIAQTMPTPLDVLGAMKIGPAAGSVHAHPSGPCERASRRSRKFFLMLCSAGSVIQ